MYPYTRECTWAYLFCPSLLLHMHITLWSIWSYPLSRGFTALGDSVPGAPNSLISRLATMNVFIFDRAPVCCYYIYQPRKLGLLHPSSGTMSPMSLPGSLSAKLAKKTSCQARVRLYRSRKSSRLAYSQATPITSKSIQEDKKNTRLVRGRASDGGSHR